MRQTAISDSEHSEGGKSMNVTGQELACWESFEENVVIIWSCL